MSIDAEAGLAEGFFAPDAERVALWRGAFRLLQLIDTDARFQPAPSSPACTVMGCTAALAARRAPLGFVRQLATSELPAPPDGTFFAQRAYLESPPTPEGEPAFALPAVTAELPLDLPAGLSRGTRRAGNQRGGRHRARRRPGAALAALKRIALLAASHLGHLLIAEQRSVKQRIGRSSCPAWPAANFPDSQRRPGLHESSPGRWRPWTTSLRSVASDIFRLGIATEPKRRGAPQRIKSPLPGYVRSPPMDTGARMHVTVTPKQSHAPLGSGAGTASGSRVTPKRKSLRLCVAIAERGASDHRS